VSLKDVASRLADACRGLRFSPPVTHVYNPLLYARAPQEAYLDLVGDRPGRVLLVGMNPGPFGMSQTGVPFGDVSMVRDWLGVSGAVARPEREHPRRPVEGFSCARSEVSGSRLWGFARDRWGSARAFLREFVVWNYCPLAFLEESGRNRTPDRLPPAERDALFRACDRALREAVERLRPRAVVGIGRFAQARARAALEGTGVPVHGMPHPSPASPAANRDWAAAATRALEGAGIEVPSPRPPRGRDRRLPRASRSE
jgi:single-strand selective monofunctional uracil DNA glycosylase